MRIAIIDCGTNTFNLLITDKKRGGFKNIYRSKRVVKLGAEGITKGIIGPKSFQRAINALIDYRGIIDSQNADKIVAVGTAAIRDAKNKNALLKEIKKKTGFKIQLISGAKEAKLIYKGVGAAVPLAENNSLVMDIGGGSVEFIIGNNKKIYWKKSFRIGAARLLEILNPSDPVSNSDVRNLDALLDQSLQPLFEAIARYNPKRLIGSSGSFDTFASIILHKSNQQKILRNVRHYKFNFNEYKILHKELLKSTYRERLSIAGMLRMRADMIVLASLLVTFVIRKSGIKSFHLSSYALKEGLLLEYIQKGKI